MIDKVMLDAWHSARDNYIGCLGAPLDDNYVDHLVMSFYKLCGVLDFMFAAGILDRDVHVSQSEFYSAFYINRRFSLI